ncbi:ribonuclease P protein component [Pararhodobacter sp.]|uniref:ribonuclease P protein component n=1 Tax=Pararhodobacter sp. TaxID=2127056 RepID=UPI002AFEBFA5|nr:ribonuclease P protein component [Pararhodobacter sp.]
MTPPDTPLCSPANGPHAEPVALSRLQVLTQRSDFLAAAKARRVPTAGFLLQARQRREAEGFDGVRIGFTCSKKIGNAVTRNRAKRRLRALAREVLASRGVAGWDYVLVGKPDATVSRDYADLLDDLRMALAKIHA